MARFRHYGLGIHFRLLPPVVSCGGRRRYSDGMHQALEAKENVTIARESQTLASITFQNFFRMYDKLAGMTGTADTEAVEFKKIYDLKTIGKVIYSSGDIKTLSCHVVYQLVYDIELFFSIMIDREGNFIGSSIKDSGLKRKMDELPKLDIV